MDVSRVPGAIGLGDDVKPRPELIGAALPDLDPGWHDCLEPTGQVGVGKVG